MNAATTSLGKTQAKPANAAEKVLSTEGEGEGAQGFASLLSLFGGEQTSVPSPMQTDGELITDENGELILLVDGKKVMSDEVVEQKNSEAKGDKELLSILGGKAKAETVSPQVLNSKSTIPNEALVQAKTQDASLSLGLMSGNEFMGLKNAGSNKVMLGKMTQNAESMNGEVNSEMPGPSIGKGSASSKAYNQGSMLFSDSLIRQKAPQADAQKGGEGNKQEQPAANMLGMALSQSNGEGRTESLDFLRSQNMTADVGAKTIDLSQIKPGNSVDLVQKITDHIQQSNLQKNGSVEVLVTHDDLGQFRVSANKTGPRGEFVDLKVHTSTPEGRDFFIKNEGEMMRSLQSNGVKVADFKLVGGTSESFQASSDGKNNSSQGDWNQGQSRSQGQFGNANQNGREGGERRRELWDMYRERMNGASA
jgi:hypothetical protein